MAPMTPTEIPGAPNGAVAKHEDAPTQRHIAAVRAHRLRATCTVRLRAAPP